MVYAAARSCPVPWGKLVRYDYEAIRNRPGVIAVVVLDWGFLSIFWPASAASAA